MAESVQAKRGRLSVIDQLPEWADEAKSWALEQLNKRKKIQLDILDEFNKRIRAAAFGQGITDPPVISKSSFNRTALRLAVMSRDREHVREIAQVLAPKFDKAGDDSVTLMIAETIKTLIFEMVTNAGKLKADGPTSEMLLNTARALTAAEQSKLLSAKGRKDREAEINAKAVAAIDHVAREKGLTAETVEAIKAKVLGITKPQPEKPHV